MRVVVPSCAALGGVPQSPPTLKSRKKSCGSALGGLVMRHTVSEQAVGKRVLMT
jgi:hypothetical protein